MEEKSKSEKFISVIQKLNEKFNFDNIEIGCILLALCVIPSIFDFATASVWGKIGMIVCNIAFIICFIFFIYLTETGNRKARFNRLVFRIFEYAYVFFAFVSSILHYINATIWGAQIYILGLFATILILYAICSAVYDLQIKSFNNEIGLIIFFALGIFLLFLGLCLNITEDERQIYFKVAIGCFYVAFISAFIKNCLFSEEQRFSLLKIFLIIIKGIFILITIPFFVQWCGLQETDFDTFVTLYSAIIGGGLTLFGVAWTIRKGDEQRKKDREQLEQDRKEEERKKYKPLIAVNEECNEGEINQKSLQFDNSQNKIKVFDVGDASIDKRIVLFNDFYIRNPDYSFAVFSGLIINGDIMFLDTGLFIDKNKTYKLQLTSKGFEYVREIKYIGLLIEDLLNNYYTIDAGFQIDDEKTNTVKITIKSGTQACITNINKENLTIIQEKQNNG